MSLADTPAPCSCKGLLNAKNTLGYSCSICECLCNTANEMKNHFREKHKTEKFKLSCTKCGEIVETNEENSHDQGQDGERNGNTHNGPSMAPPVSRQAVNAAGMKYLCGHCKNEYGSDVAFFNHHSIIHVECRSLENNCFRRYERRFVCRKPDCGYLLFPTWDALTKHYMKEHGQLRSSLIVNDAANHRTLDSDIQEVPPEKLAIAGEGVPLPKRRRIEAGNELNIIPSSSTHAVKVPRIAELANNNIQYQKSFENRPANDFNRIKYTFSVKDKQTDVRQSNSYHHTFTYPQEAPATSMSEPLVGTSGAFPAQLIIKQMDGGFLLNPGCESSSDVNMNFWEKDDSHFENSYIITVPGSSADQNNPAMESRIDDKTLMRNNFDLDSSSDNDKTPQDS